MVKISTPPHQKSGKYKKPRAVFFQDELILVLSSLLAILVIRGVTNPIPSFTQRVLLWLLAAAACSAIGIFSFQLYREVRRYATVRSIGRTLCSVGVKEACLAAVLLTGLIPLPKTGHYVILLLIDFFLSAGGLFYVRISARIYSGAMRQTDIMKKACARTALVRGTGLPSIHMAQNLEKEGYDVAGLLTTNSAMEGRVIADYVVYAFNSEEDIRQLQWRLGGIDCIFFPQTEPTSEQKTVDTVPQTDGMSKVQHFVKRGFDMSFSAFLLLGFSPVILACAIAIKLEDGGPVLFRQERIGKAGKPFNILKFRSMCLDAEKDGKPELYCGEEDPRLTKTGRFLRAHHLDELPQLWNVLVGDMSFIGYRPERAYYIRQIMQRNARYRYLYQIRPGVTSYATLYNGYTNTLDKMLVRLDLDLYYLRNHSLWFDAKVLGLTFLSIVSGKKF